ncbi:hypothetical protein DSM25558_4509 [Agrobacterium sp. DSM 25558]|nr:hypothetical protein DSM25558_4509 [Agrobacterium sp. DSM 25558]
MEALDNASDASLAEERHVVVVVHQELVNGSVTEKAYFYDSAEVDNGGGGPFDFMMDEALVRAKRFASDNKIAKVVVRTTQL